MGFVLFCCDSFHHLGQLWRAEGTQRCRGRGHPEGAGAEGRWEARLGSLIGEGGAGRGLARTTFWPCLEWGVSQVGDHLAGQAPGSDPEALPWAIIPAAHPGNRGDLCSLPVHLGEGEERSHRKVVNVTLPRLMLGPRRVVLSSRP